MAEKKTYHILSLDGGGIRGLTSAILLESLEKKLQEHEQKPEARLRDYFDLIAGTSAGSIIACGIARGISATQIKNLFLKRGKDIFPEKWWNQGWFQSAIKNLWKRITTGFTQPMYDGMGLERVLKDVFGEEFLFEALSKPTLITSYDTYNRQAIVFKNTDRLIGKIPVWEICRSSAAAPVAFPAYGMKNLNFIDYYKTKNWEIPSEGSIPLIDGGVIANDPVLCAIAERLHWNVESPDNKEKWIPPEYEWVDIKEIVVASFGCGQPIEGKIGIKQARGWGIEWASPLRDVPIVDILFDGSTKTSNYIAQQVLWKGKYFRFQPILDEQSSISPFDANTAKLRALQQKVESFCQAQAVQSRITQLVNSLTSKPSKPSV
jgi:patatin-like phospholipase/acyl hydrolase